MTQFRLSYGILCQGSLFMLFFPYYFTNNYKQLYFKYELLDWREFVIV